MYIFIFIIAAVAFVYCFYMYFRRNALINDFRKAAESGDADAQFEMGVRHQHGRGVPQDFFKAVSFYREAAEQGHLGAQSNLGILYASGQGIPRDYDKALFWFTKAANKGNASAQHNLCRMYSFGEGVTQDYVTAYMWLELAIGGLDGIQKSKAQENRDLFLASHMTSEEIERAKRMVAEWIADHSH